MERFEAWAEVIARDYEGLVAKDKASLYEAGPTRRWLNVKQKGWTVEEDHWSSVPASPGHTKLRGCRRQQKRGMGDPATHAPP